MEPAALTLDFLLVKVVVALAVVTELVYLWVAPMVEVAPAVTVGFGDRGQLEQSE
jgi:hypothetical protein